MDKTERLKTRLLCENYITNTLSDLWRDGFVTRIEKEIIDLAVIRLSTVTSFTMWKRKYKRVLKQMRKLLEIKGNVDDR